MIPIPRRLPQAAVLLALCMSLDSGAQTTSLNGGTTVSATDRNDPTAYARALHHFEHAQYSAALAGFDAVVHAPLRGDQAAGETERLERVEAEHRAALCAIYLFHKDAVWRIDRFVDRHPESTWVPKLHWELGNYQYRRKKWGKALEAFDRLNPRHLGKVQRTEFHFKRGHARFEQGDLEAARGDLLKVTGSSDARPDFLEAARYYLAHIAYAEDRFTTALDEFEALASVDAFRDAVPVYIGQILHELDRHEDLVDRVPTWLGEDHDLREADATELSRLLGTALFHLGRCPEAEAHLEAAWSAMDTRDKLPGFSYIVGSCRLENGHPQEAILALMRATGNGDQLDQYATHALGRAYLDNDEKPKAQAAFAQAAQFDHDLEVREDALFNHAKLAFETDFNPFNDAIAAFEQYLEEYPDSPRRDEAYGFLLDVYLTTRNSERALDALDRIQRKSPREKQAYQGLAFNHGVDLYRSGKPEEADAYFSRSRSFPEDNTLAAESHFWQGEIAMKAGRDAAALSHYRAFLNAPGAFGSPLYDEGEYGAAYALFRQRKYRDAQVGFRKYVDAAGSGEAGGHRADALLRIGDCFYIDKDYGRAIDAYDRALGANTSQRQYAGFQRARCLGLDGQLDASVEGMTNLLQEFPETTFKGDALTAMGKAEIERDRMEAARSAFDRIREELPGSAYAKNALVDLALIAIKQYRADDALALWSTISTTYPDDDVTKDAFLLVEPLLVERGQLDGLPEIVGLSENDIAEKTYAAAQDLALSGQCAEAMPKLEGFLEKHPESVRVLSARFHLGQCQFESGQTDEALATLETVVEAPLSDYHESALVLTATLRYNREDWREALAHYQRLETVATLKRHVLEARIGIMRCSRKLDDGETVLAYVDPILADPETPADIVMAARYNRALLLLERSPQEARSDLEWLAGDGTHAEEASHHLAALTLDAGDAAGCQSAVFAQLNRFGGGSEWAYRSFLLLAESYLAQGDLFQARTTIEQLQANVAEPWVQDACLDFLDRIAQEENPPAPTDSTAVDTTPQSDNE